MEPIVELKQTDVDSIFAGRGQTVRRPFVDLQLGITIGA
jgi:hypothetical protein